MNAVLRLGQIHAQPLIALLQRYGLQLKWVEPETVIPGSYWGDEEAGLIGDQCLARADTPIHSILHESCHYICMDGQRRAQLHTDAGGSSLEENGECFLQIVLADYLPEMGRTRMLRDMDAWGYSFRLGSAQTWFEQDAQDAQEWLQQQGLIEINTKTAVIQPTFRLRP